MCTRHLTHGVLRVELSVTRIPIAMLILSPRSYGSTPHKNTPNSTRNRAAGVGRAGRGCLVLRKGDRSVSGLRPGALQPRIRQAGSGVLINLRDVVVCALYPEIWHRSARANWVGVMSHSFPIRVRCKWDLKYAELGLICGSHQFARGARPAKAL